MESRFFFEQAFFFEFVKCFDGFIKQIIVDIQSAMSW